MAVKKKATGKILVGNREWCALPALGIPAVKARIDSGAKTSSIHAFNIRKFRKKGELWVRFEIHPIQKNKKTSIHCEAPVIDERKVKSSSGHSEKRFVIATPLQLGTESWEIELTLSNRDAMGYRMLLGRQAMNGRILIDPEHGYCLGRLGGSALKQLYTTKDLVKQP